MKNKLFPALILTILLVLITAIILEHDKHKRFVDRLDKMNIHIKYLHDEEGYSWEASRKIGATEAGFIPADAEYNGLIED